MANHTILLIDYEPRSIERTRRALVGAGYVVEVATDGPAGLAAFDRIKPALVLVEAMLPKKHGFEVCQELKRTPLGQRTPIIITTGVYKGRKYRTQALHTHKCDEYLEKPVPDEQLLGCVAKFIGEPGVVELPISGPAPSVGAHPSDASSSTLVELDSDIIEIVDDEGEPVTVTDAEASGRNGTSATPDGGTRERDAWEDEIAARLDALLGADADALRLGDVQPASVDPPRDKAANIESATTEATAVAVAVTEERPEGESSAEASEVSPTLEFSPSPAPAPADEPVERLETDDRIGDVVPIDSKRGRKGRRRPEGSIRALESIPIAPAGESEPAPIVMRQAEKQDEPEGLAARPIGPSVAVATADATGNVDTSPRLPEPSRSKRRSTVHTMGVASSRAEPRSRAWLWLVLMLVAAAAAVYFLFFRGHDLPIADGFRPAPVTRPATRTARPAAPTPLPPPIASAENETRPADDPGARAPIPSDTREPPASDGPRTATAPSRAGPGERASRPTPTPPGRADSSTPVAPPVQARSRANDPPAQENPTLSPADDEAEPLGIEPVAADGMLSAATLTREGTTERGQLLLLSEVDSPPVAIKRTLPSYTSRARILRQQGTVELSVLIDENGSVVDVRVVGGIPESDLNDAAVAAARQWVYRPARRDGVPVKTTKIEKIAFKL